MLNELLRQQDGVITLLQANGVGLSNSAIQRRVRAGDWRRYARGVYFVDDREFSDAARIRAAVWAHGEHAAASGLAAAWWHRLTMFPPDIVEVTVPRNSHGRSHEGARVRRRNLGTADVTVVRGLNVTELALTVVEASVRRRGGVKLMDRALQQRLDLRALWRAHLRNAGRYGAPAARRLLQGAADGARSEAERILVALLRQAGLTGWRTNHPVAGYKVDAAFPARKVAIEIDGFAFHTDEDVFQSDRRRQNDIALAGWQILRFTWLDLTEFPERVIAVIRAAISAR